MAGVIRAMTPRAVFFNADRLFDISAEVPAEPLINTDVYWHEAANPVASARLLGTFQVGYDIPFTLPLSKDTDVALRAMGRGARGLTTVADIRQAEPILMNVKGLGGGAIESLKENDGYSYVRTLPNEPTLNFLQSFKLTDDPAHLETDITTYGVPNGMLNAKTDFFASGAIAVTSGTIAASALSTLVCAARLDLQPNQGIYIAGAAAGGGPLITTITSVSDDGKTFQLAAPAAAAVTTPALVQSDDTLAIQNWINAKGDLWLPPGYYRLTASIVVPTTSEGFSVIIHGSGWDVTVLAWQHGGDGFVPTPPDLKIDSFTLMDLTVSTGTVGDSSGTIDANSTGIGIRFVAPAVGGVYNNNVMQRCRVIGWGRWGAWSDNLQVCWFNNVIWRSNRCGHVAFVAPDTRETYKLPNANALVNCTFENAQGGMTSLRSVSASMTAGSRTLSGSGFTAADRGCLVIVPGAGVGSPAADLFSFIDVVNSSSSVTLAHQATTSTSTTASVFPLAVASVLLVRAHDTLISGATFQGNFDSSISSTTTDTNTIKVYASDNLHLESIHEEDTGGFGGAAVRLEGCRATLIENWGGTSAEAGAVNAHNCDFELHDCHAVAVRGSFFNDRPQFNIDSTSSETTIDDSLIVGWINLWQQDRSWDKLRVGSGVRSYQAASALTSQSCGNEYIYDGLFGRDLLENGRFLDSTGVSGDLAGMASWAVTNPTWWSRTATALTRGGTYIKVDATAIASGGAQKILAQSVAIPDTTPAGQFTLAFDWYIESQVGAPDIGGQYTEVRLHPSSGNDETMTWWTRAFTYVTGVWQTAQIKCWLDGSTSRTIEVQVNVTPGPNNVILRLANFRLTRGKHSFGSWERAIHDFGGRMHAPIEFAPIAAVPTPPPVGSNVISMIDDAGVLKISQNGSAYAPVSTALTGATGHTIQDEGVDLVQQPKLNFTGPGVVASNNGPSTRTDVLIQTASTSLEGCVSTSAQGFAGRKTFNNGLQTIDGSGAVPLVAQWTYGAGNGSIQEWWTSGPFPLATLDTQATLRLGRPFTTSTGFKGVLELCDDTGSGTFKLQAGFNPTAQIVSWPRFTPSAGQVLQVQSFDGPSGNVILQWGTISAPSGGYATIADEGTLLTQRAILNFIGPGVVASDNSGSTRTDVTIQTASTSLEGTVSTSAQGFAGRKTFNNGLQTIDAASVPLVAQYAGSTTGAHIQEWWGTGVFPLASIDTQPTLRLGSTSPSRAGFLELCNDTSTNTLRFAAAVGAAQQQITFPASLAVAAGQILSVQSVGSGNVNLQWTTPPNTYQSIYDEGSLLISRSALNVRGPGVRAYDETTSGPWTVIEVLTADDTQSGTVSTSGQLFAGKKFFKSGAVVGYPVSTGGTLGTLEFADGSSTFTALFRQLAVLPQNFVYNLPAALPTLNQVLTATAVSGGTVTFGWSSPAGGIAGSGTVNYIARFTPDGVTLGNSSFQDDGSTITALNRIIGSGEGNINLGDIAGHRIGGLYCINGVFIETIGTTRTSPHSFGFYPQYSSPTGDESGQIFLYASRNLLQAGNQIRTTLGSYYGIELRGTRGQTTGVTPSTGSSSDPSVSIFAETTNVSVLQLKAISGTTANLLEMLNGASTVARVNGSGDAYFNTCNVPGSGSNTCTINSGGVSIGASGGGSAALSASQVAVSNGTDSFAIKPGHKGTSTGVIYAEVNGSAANTKQIPFGNGSVAGDYFTWSTALSTWVISAAPSGGGGANTALSNLTATSINQSFVFNSDGVYNIGDPTNRVGAIYLKNAFFVYTTGSSISTNSPHAAGFLDPASGECSRLLIAGNQSVAQGGFGQRTSITAYYGIELHGSRLSGTAPGFVAGATSDPGVLVIGERDVTAFRIDSTTTISSGNLFEALNFGTNKFVIRSDGSVVQFGGLQFAGRTISAATTLTTADSLVICDAASSYTVTLPSAFTNGLVIFLVRETFSGSGTITVAVQSGDVFEGVTNGTTTLTAALQKKMFIAWNQRWYSFAV